jgi:predicted metal-dependent phosphoesterase TrpH
VGLQRLAVTDHDRIEGAFAAREADPDLVIVGEEVRTSDGPELIGLFLDEFVPPGRSFRETARAVREQGGLTYLPHPFDPRRGTTASFLRERVDCVDLVEGFNARTHDDDSQVRARRWAREHGLPVGAGSDAHLLRAVGRGRLRVPPFDGPEELVEAARHGEIRGRESGWLVHLGSTLARLAGRLGG